MDTAANVSVLIATASVIVLFAGNVIKHYFDRHQIQQDRHQTELQEINKSLAVVLHRLGEMEKDINGLGTLVRKKLV
jgi:hypothetical protein